MHTSSHLTIIQLYCSLKPHKSHWEAKALVFLFYSDREQVTYPNSHKILWQPLGYQPEDSLFHTKICILAHVFYTSWALEWICLTCRQCRPTVCIVSHQPSPWSGDSLSVHQMVLWEDGRENTQHRRNPCSASSHGSEAPTTVLGSTAGNGRTHSTFLNYTTSKQSHG